MWYMRTRNGMANNTEGARYSKLLLVKRGEVNYIPTLLHLIVGVVTFHLLQLGNSARVVVLDEVERTPVAEAHQRTCSLRRKTVPDVRQEKPTAAEGTLYIYRGRYNFEW